MSNLKTCLSCGNQFKGQGEYCNQKSILDCLHCGKSIESLCNNRPKKYCDRSCAANHKRNSCINCGKPAKGKYCRETIYINCKVCNKLHETKCQKTISTYCSGACAMKDEVMKEKVKKSQYEKYNGKFAFNTEKQSETMIKMYGHSTPAKNKKVKEKIKKTQYKNNNGNFAFNTDKQKKTMMSKYNSLGRLGDPNEMEKQRAVMYEKYGVETPTEHPKFLKKAHDTLLKKYGRIFNGDNSNISKLNKNTAQLIHEKLKVEVEFEHFVEKSFFDLYIPEFNIAIEINPTVTHNSTISFACIRNGCSQIPCKTHKSISKDYHLSRAIIAKNNDLDLIQIYEWDSDEELINLIKENIYILRHTCKNKKDIAIDKKQYEKSLFDIDEDCYSQIHCYELTLENKINSSAIFAECKEHNDKWILIYYKDKENSHYNFENIMDKFVKDFSPVEVVGYIDFNKNTKKETYLSKTGFVEEKDFKQELVLHNRSSKDIIKNTSLLNSEEINKLINNGYVKVFTAGYRIFTWNK